MKMQYKNTVGKNISNHCNSCVGCCFYRISHSYCIDYHLRICDPDEYFVAAVGDIFKI